MINSTKILLLFTVIILTINCTTEKKKENSLKAETTLKTKFKNNFYIGAAINDNQLLETDTLAVDLIKKEFNTITPENIMKWMYVHPKPDTFYFDMTDKYVDFGVKNNMNIVGHTLVWHSQIAPFMNKVKDSVLMTKYITNQVNTIVNRYKGKINTWDVVNEAFNEDGTFRTSNFYNVMGENYIDLAFNLAAKADPNAELIYNDYNLWKPTKRAGVVRLVKKLQAKGIKIDGIGMQAHYGLTEPSIKDIENSIIAYAELGLKVSFTELDVTVLPNPWDLNGAAVEQNYEQFEGDVKMDPYRSDFPQEMEQKLAKRYEELFNLFLKHQDKINRVTFWGVNDGSSWLNNWPIQGRTNHPLLFDRKFQQKEAYKTLLNLNN
ncbi:endo-1,4-beta-xylanase [Lutibacter sp. TH_r2]|uniref:endo-1,4-beta-xylanase n=1 Tax=Lutibacter sp. TH_r2 TaxID=3082083 RepID=UPI0029536E96|nr:endo-1,4-beta-xylanase [Lutibacter sp. TH_r2]MDV7188604.1 endo-1,4-beta-xylanase [Lutibacter sp. TH_r2]